MPDLRLRCPVHSRPLVCPACLGARGGQQGGTATSPEKAAAARANGKQPKRPRQPEQRVLGRPDAN